MIRNLPIKAHGIIIYHSKMSNIIVQGGGYWMAFTTKVVGVTVPERQEMIRLISGIKPDKLKVKLKHQKDNQYDSNCVNVIINEYHIGNLNTELASQIAQELDRGVGIKVNVSRISCFENTFGILLRIEDVD